MVSLVAVPLRAQAATFWQPMAEGAEWPRYGVGSVDRLRPCLKGTQIPCAEFVPQSDRVYFRHLRSMHVPLSRRPECRHSWPLALVERSDCTSTSRPSPLSPPPSPRARLYCSSITQTSGLSSEPSCANCVRRAITIPDINARLETWPCRHERWGHFCL